MKSLPNQKIFRTPRILVADAYTIGSNKFESEEAKEESVYYITFRRNLNKIDPELYEESDNRIVFNDLDRIVEELFRDPFTHAEIDEAKEFLKTAKATALGFKNYDFPEELWRGVVDEFEGYIPMEILGMPNGSVVYPNEPVVQVRNLVKGFGVFAAWFESKLLQVWATTERVTQNEHIFKYFKTVVKRVEPDLSEEMNNFYASLMLTDFGDRAGICSMESEVLGKVHLYTFGGTDTFCGAYQAWKNSGQTPQGTSVNALAHRNVQSFVLEKDAYRTLYDSSENDAFLSMVSDCNDFFFATKNYILPLAIESQEKGNGKIVVDRPDSGDALEQILYILNLSVENNLYSEREIDGVKWKFATTLHFIEGDGLSFSKIKMICERLLELGFAPYSWGLFGVGGGLRNGLKRDNLSAKYALCATATRSVVKFSETFGKTTLPGPFKVLRTAEALQNKVTIVFENEEGENALIKYYNGLDTEIFGTPLYEDFIVVKQRIREQMSTMPFNLETPENHNYPASKAVLDKRREFLALYAPDKKAENY